MTTKEYNNTEIAKRVELLRKRSGMSINKMATMAGIDTGNLSRSINGKASFSDRVIYKIASALHVSVDWLEKVSNRCSLQRLQVHPKLVLASLDLISMHRIVKGSRRLSAHPMPWLGS